MPKTIFFLNISPGFECFPSHTCDFCRFYKYLKALLCFKSRNRIKSKYIIKSNFIFGINFKLILPSVLTVKWMHMREHTHIHTFRFLYNWKLKFLDISDSFRDNYPVNFSFYSVHKELPAVMCLKMKKIL